MVRPAAKRHAVGHLLQTHGLSERRSCRLVNLSRTVNRYQRKPSKDEKLGNRLRTLAETYPRYGYPTLHSFVFQEGLVVNRKRTYRVYRELGLQVRAKRRKRLKRPRIPMLVPNRVDMRWSLDFMSDQLANGRRFRVLNIVDDYSRECIGQIVDVSISGHQLSRLLDELLTYRCKPHSIVMDNGPELTSKAMFLWSQRTKVNLHFIQPGKPTQNAFVESFNGKFRDNCLNQYWFIDLDDARRTIAAWRKHYNEVRPHSSLGYLPPSVFANKAA